MKHWEEIIRWKINKPQKIDKSNLTRIQFYKRKSQLELFFNNATTFFRWNFDELEEYIYQITTDTKKYYHFPAQSDQKHTLYEL